jgi:N-carbamoylputrescine amidase
VTEGYFEDEYFTPGAATPASDRVRSLPLPGSPKLGMPTCWDEWFPELARDLALAGADLLCYPTAIGSEPDYPDFDTSELLLKTVTGHAIANGLFIAVPNRWGDEGRLKFYGKSFVVDPFGRTLAIASSSADELLVVELDLDQRRDWLELFPFFATRRPDTYGALSEPLQNPRQPNGRASLGGIPGIRPW